MTYTTTHKQQSVAQQLQMAFKSSDGYPTRNLKPATQTKDMVPGQISTGTRLMYTDVPLHPVYKTRPKPDICYLNPSLFKATLGYPQGH